MTDRELWLIIRRALLMIVHAIDARYRVAQEHAPMVETISTTVDNITHVDV